MKYGKNSRAVCPGGDEKGTGWLEDIFMEARSFEQDKVFHLYEAHIDAYKA